MAIYICNSKTHKIESIIAGHEGTISCLVWNQLDENLLASATAENQLYVWGIEQEKPVLHLHLPAYALIMQWSQLDTSSILMLLASGTDWC